MCWPCVVRGGRGKTADAPAVLAAAGAAAAVPGKRNKKTRPAGALFFYSRRPYLAHRGRSL